MDEQKVKRAVDLANLYLAADTDSDSYWRSFCNSLPELSLEESDLYLRLIRK